jgi:hypothetical protein
MKQLAVQFKLSPIQLTRSLLRSTTLSFAGKKEGEKVEILRLTLFTIYRREGRPAKRPSG